jgi:hypothetical protein
VLFSNAVIVWIPFRGFRLTVSVTLFTPHRIPKLGSHKK